MGAQAVENVPDAPAAAVDGTTPLAGGDAAAGAQRRRFTVDEYYRMAEAGILRPDERVELIEGEIVVMSPIGPMHAADVTRLSTTFHRCVGERALVRVQLPLRVNDHAEPEPDLMLVRPRADFYAAAHPTAEDTLLVVEVADSSLVYDREVKAALYARAGVPEMWLVDVQRRAVEVRRDPSPEGYRRVERFQPGQEIAPLALPDVSIAVAEMLG